MDISVDKMNFLLALLFTIFLRSRADFNPFMDNIYFQVNWPGPSAEPLTDENSMVVRTAENEQYRCILPEEDLNDKLQKEKEGYAGPSELELLQPLMQQTSCSYRIETYWTYELCHGKYLRQYHEEKEVGKKPKVQEYFLGNLNKPKTAVPVDETTATPIERPPAQETQTEPAGPPKIQTLKVDGNEFPYFAVNFTNGTPCELTKGFRRATLRYVCHQEGKGEMYELKESSTCEYEVTVLTSLLCSHPRYRPSKDPVNSIQCHAMEGAPIRPRNLDNLMLFNSDGKFSQPPKQEREPDTKAWVKPPKEARNHRVESTVGITSDKQLLRDFLNGDYCLHGGSGWWKHEFCYGKSVSQYHEEPTGKTTITLGIWDKEKHLSFLEKNPSKRPKTKRSYIVQFYSGGDICDLTQQPRTAEVKLKCKENKQHPHAVSIYLVEPTTCEYVLVVESPIFCGLIEKADENGILQGVQP